VNILDRMLDGWKLWCQWDLRRRDGATCLLGRLCDIVNPSDDGRTFAAAVQALKKRAGLGEDDSLTAWNDEPGRTFAQVKELIAQASKEWTDG
jgi:hypothetical protein